MDTPALFCGTCRHRNGPTTEPDRIFPPEDAWKFVGCTVDGRTGVYVQPDRRACRKYDPAGE